LGAPMLIAAEKNNLTVIAVWHQGSVHCQDF
jgi:hypothetical protein